VHVSCHVWLLHALHSLRGMTVRDVDVWPSAGPVKQQLCCWYCTETRLQV
jgi:hypothetical protein